jgi:hypothetical protein
VVVLCEGLCNLSQRAALRFLRDMDVGHPVPQFVTREACLEKLDATKKGGPTGDEPTLGPD